MICLQGTQKQWSSGSYGTCTQHSKASTAASCCASLPCIEDRVEDVMPERVRLLQQNCLMC